MAIFCFWQMAMMADCNLQVFTKWQQRLKMCLNITGTRASHKYVFGDWIIAKGEMNMYPPFPNGGARKKRNTFWVHNQMHRDMFYMSVNLHATKFHKMTPGLFKYRIKHKKHIHLYNLMRKKVDLLTLHDPHIFHPISQISSTIWHICSFCGLKKLWKAHIQWTNYVNYV
jgi:hypothetical protein